MAEVWRSMKAGEAGEAFRSPHLVGWLPEAEWEWHDRIHSNLWPCELPSGRREKLAFAKPSHAGRRDSRK